MFVGRGERISRRGGLVLCEDGGGDEFLHGLTTDGRIFRFAQKHRAAARRTECVTWGELVRKLKAAGYVEQRSGKGSHRQFIHPTTGHVITVAVHTKKEVGTGLANRILKEAGSK